MPAVNIDADSVERARSGDREALGAVLESLRPVVHRLAVSMLWDSSDAEDATQEILVKVMTSLGGWRGEATLTTWAYGIAIRHLARRRKSATEAVGVSFDAFAGHLVEGLADSSRADAEVLAQEVRVGCTLGMLQCLDRDERITYVLGEILGLPGQQAADIMGVGHDAYRKRLSRARGSIQSFVSAHCGLVNDGAACRCTRRVERAIEVGRIDARTLRFAEANVATIQHLQDAGALMRALPELAGDHATVTRLLQLIPTAMNDDRNS